MNTPDNYYAILGVPLNADSDTLKRSYRQLARRYHPDLAGPEGAVQMKRINRAYDVLSDPEKRFNYDTIIGGVIDLRRGGVSHVRPRERNIDPAEKLEFAGLSIFSTRGPLHTGPVLHTNLGVITVLTSVQASGKNYIAAGSLDGKGLIWWVDEQDKQVTFAADPTLPIESLRDLRFSASGKLLAGWGRTGLQVWNAANGAVLWRYSLLQRAVSAHYSLDIVLQEMPQGLGEVRMALPLLPNNVSAPRAWGVRATDIVTHILGTPDEQLNEPLVCAEDDIEKRQFWAIRLRKLAQTSNTLLTLSCAHVPGESGETAIIRRWDLNARMRFGGKPRPQIVASVLAGTCADCSPPYAVTPDASLLAYTQAGNKIRLYDTTNGTYSELLSGTMGGSSRLSISPDGQWVVVAREDSEANEGVIDLWSVNEGRMIQKLYHPWQISALHFAEKQLLVALTDGTLQIWA